MNINWKERFRNKTFLLALLAWVYGSMQVLGIIIDTEVWKQVVLGGVDILLLIGIVVDPSSPGLTDRK